MPRKPAPPPTPTLLEGRLQYFYHSPSSTLPVRDVLNEQRAGHKTEPHLECGAENYLKSCCQPSILSHIKRNEGYLFLYTRCRNRDIATDFPGQRIVGYLKREGQGLQHISCAPHTFVIGETRVFSFADSLPLRELGFTHNVRNGRLDRRQTGKVLEHFSTRDDITSSCIDEIIRLDTQNHTCYHGRELSHSKLYDCPFHAECPRGTA